MAKKPRKRRVAILWITLVIVGGLGYNLYDALRPEALEQRLRDELSNRLACEYRFDHFDVSYSGSVEIQNLELEDVARPGKNFLKIGRVRVVPKLSSILFGDFQIHHISVQGLELIVERRGDGSWNFERALKKRPKEGGDPGPKTKGEGFSIESLPEVAIDDCHIRYADTVFGRPFDEEVRNLRLRLGGLSGDSDSESNSGAGAASFELDVETAFANRLRVHGSIERGADSFSVQANANAFKVNLGGPFDRFLPEEAADALRKLAPRGHVDIGASLSFDSERGLRVQRIKGTVLQARSLLPGAPFDLVGVEGSIELQDPGDGVLRGAYSFDGEFGDGVVTLSGKTALNSETLDLVEWESTLDIPSVTVDPKLAERCEPKAARWLRDLDLRGALGIRVTVPPSKTWIPDTNAVAARLEMLGVSGAFHTFPYPFHDARGVLIAKGGTLVAADGSSFKAGKGDGRIEKFFIELRRGGKVDVELRVDKAVADETLLTTAPVKTRRVLESLGVQGGGDVMIRLSREAVPPEEVAAIANVGKLISVRVEIEPRDAKMRYQHFPYEVSDLKGKIIVDSSLREVILENVSGRHGRHVIQGIGIIGFDNRKGVDIKISCDDLDVDKDLIAAVPQSSRNLLEDFGFRGRVSAVTRVTQKGLEKPIVSVDANVIEVGIKHRRFPYPLGFTSGRMEVDGRGQISFSGFKTVDGQRPNLEFSGEVTQAEEGPVVDCVFNLAELEFDEVLHSTLPDRLKRFFERSGFSGSYSGLIKSKYRVVANKPSDNVFTYQGFGVRSSDAGLNFGLEVSDVVGSADFEGVSGPGDKQEISGHLELESGRFNRLRLRGGQIEFAFGKLHPIFAPGPRNPRLPPTSYQVSDAIRDRLVGIDMSDILQLSVTTENFYSGKVRGFLYMDTSRNPKSRAKQEYRGDFIASGIDMALAARDVFEAEADTASGMAKGFVRFSGKVGDWEGLVGTGEGTITEARLAEVPLFGSLFEQLKSQGAVFSEMRMPYLIQKGRFVSDRIRLKSSLLDLAGKGSLGFEGDLDLKLQPSLIDVNIPIITQVLNAVKKVVSEVHIKGTLGKPKVSFRTFFVEVDIDAKPSTKAPSKPKTSEKEDPAGKTSDETPSKKAAEAD